MDGPAAVMFDMDGLLVDSEPLWRDAEVEVFSAVGVPLQPGDCAATQGLRLDRVVAYWRARHPWTRPTDDEVAGRIVQAVVARVRAGAVAKPGVPHALGLARGLGCPVAIVSSSPPPIIAAVVDRLGLRETFRALVSAEGLPAGKPDPAVYLHAAAVLGVDARRCVALEDSPSGVQAAVAAGMRCIAVPDHGIKREAVAAAHVVLPSLEVLSAAHLVP